MTRFFIGVTLLHLVGVLRLSAAEPPTPVKDSEPVNHPPQLLEPIKPQTVNEGEPFFIMVRAVDPDEDSLRVTVSGLPDGAQFEDLGKGWATIEWIPRFDQSGQYEIIIRVEERVSSTTPLSLEERVPVAVRESSLAISGRVTHPYSPLPIVGVTVQLVAVRVGSPDQFIQQTTTDERGDYLLKDVPPGTYKVRPSYVATVEQKTVKQAVKPMGFNPPFREVTVTDRDVPNVKFERAL